MVERTAGGLFLESETSRGVALRVTINEKGASLCCREGCGQIYRGRRLAYATLLVGDGNDFPQVDFPPVRANLAELNPIRQHVSCCQNLPVASGGATSVVLEFLTSFPDGLGGM